MAFKHVLNKSGKKPKAGLFILLLPIDMQIDSLFKTYALTIVSDEMREQPTPTT